MNRISASLALTVVPDSATDELTGLFGTMEIKITEVCTTLISNISF